MTKRYMKTIKAKAVIGPSVFTARHNARIAGTVLAIAIPSVCLSVTRRYCVAKSV